MYDISTNIGKVRLWIGDTDDNALVFSDDEISYFLTQGSDVYASAALAILACINSKTMLAKRTNLYGYETEEHAVKDLLAIYDKLKGLSPNAGGITTGDIDLTGELITSFAPEWIPDDETGIGVSY